MSEKDALDKLIVDEEENPDKELLANLVCSYLKFDKKSGKIMFEGNFYKLKEWQKFLVFILGRKVVLIKNLQKEFDEKISPKEASEILGMKAPTLRKYVSADLKGIVKSEKGKYYIPNYNLHKCKEKLDKDGKSKVNK